jgi:hypothetical protein
MLRRQLRSVHARWAVPLLTLALLGAFTLAPSLRPVAEACAFLRTPEAYEADSSRAAYSAAMDAAAIDALFPNDPTFGLPAIEVGGRSNRAAGPKQLPQSLLRSIGWIESNLTMAARSVPFQSKGPALVSFDCGHGIMQITTGMTVPLGMNNQPTSNQSNVATHYVYNVARGATMLAEKWNQAPELRPLAGTDTNSNPAIIENWYFAVWAYNGFTGPGANISNHPLDPQFANPRGAYRCDASQSRTRYPYQELVWGCMQSPPTANGQRLWAPAPVTLPDLSQPQFFQPLSIANFVFPYPGMDIPTPQPAHTDPPPAVAPDYRARVLGAPAPAVNGPPVDIRPDAGPSGLRGTVEVTNSGTGILVWSASTSANWIIVDPPAGVALGSDVPCSTTAGCRATSSVTISANPVLLPQSAASGTVTIMGSNAAGAPATVTVNVVADFDAGASGTSRAY